MLSVEELKEIRVLFVGMWDVLGRRAPLLFAEIESRQAEVLDLRNQLASGLTREDALRGRIAELEAANAKK